MWDALERFARAADRLSRAGGVLGGALAIVMMLTIGREVIGRYFFNAPTSWVVELDGYLLVALVYLGGGYILQNDAHIRVDIVYSRLSPRARARADLFGLALAVPFLGFVIWQGGLLTWYSWAQRDRSVVMDWPLWLPELAVPVGAALLLLQVLAIATRRARFLARGE